MAVHFYRRRREYSNSFQCVSLFLFFPALVLFFRFIFNSRVNGNLSVRLFCF